MNYSDFSAHRALLVGRKTHTLGLLRSILNLMGITKVHQVEKSARALDMLMTESFTAVFCSADAETVGEVSFAVAARRRHGLLNPTIPIYLVQERARRRDVESARDTGVTDILTTPISPRTVMTKLRAAEVAPRPFIVSTEFCGPDRRSKTRAPWPGLERRTRTPKKTKVDFTQL